MNRKIKNIVMIVMAITMCIFSYFTMSGATKNAMPDNRFGNNQNQGETPPNFNKGEIPEMPEGGFQNGEVPEMPEGGFKNGEMPDISGLPENMQKDFENGNMKNFDNNFSNRDFKQNISVLYYILFIVEALIISLLITYLIMSKFNEKTLKETIENSKRIVIFVVLTVVITIGLTFLQITLVRNVFPARNRTQFENMKMPRNDYNNENVIENNNETNETESV